MKPAVVLLAVLVAGTSAQRRDAPEPLLGRIVLAEDPAVPVRGAQVRLAVRATPVEPVFSGADGGFTVPRDFTALVVRKAGFAPLVVNVPAGGGLVIPLSRGATLTGLLTDELGFPVPDARVRARWVDATPGAAAAGLADVIAETSDRGEFRIGSLPPGTYTVHSEPQVPRPGDGAIDLPHDVEMRLMEMRRTIAARVIVMSDPVQVQARAGEETSVRLVHRRPAVSTADEPIAGAVNGTVRDEFGDPLEGIAVRLWRLRYAGDRYRADPAGPPRTTDDRGQFRLYTMPPGRYLVVASMEDAHYAPVFAPGVTTIGDALSVLIGRNQEASVDIVFRRTRQARITGTAVTAAGASLQGRVVLTPAHAGGAVTPSPRIVTTVDGTFEFPDVAPGEYVLRAMRYRSPLVLAEFGARTIAVSETDPPPQSLVTAPATTLTGRLVIEGDTSRLPDGELAIVQVPDADAGPLESRVPPVAIATDTFQIAGLAGPFRLRLARAPTGWWLKTADIAGINAAEIPVTLQGRGNEVRLVIATNAATLTGRVRDEAGRPPDDYRVLVFSASPARWFAGSPYVRVTGGPDGDGGFTLRTLPPDDYFVIALDTIDGDGDAGEWQNPDVLNRLASAATRLSLDEGQRGTITLRLNRWIP